MPSILHIETSTEQCSVALAQGMDLLASKKILESGFTHAKKLHLLIQELLRETQTTPSQLDAIAVSEGPGSFTGLRIGSVAAKGLCFALDIPLLAIPTLQLLAAPYWESTKVVSLLDARRNEVYTATFDKGGKTLLDTHAHILTETSFDSLALDRVSFVGTGAEKAKEILPQHENWQFLTTYPSAETMPLLSYKAFKNQQYTDIQAFAPAYLKPVRITPSKKDLLGRVV